MVFRGKNSPPTYGIKRECLFWNESTLDGRINAATSVSLAFDHSRFIGISVKYESGVCYSVGSNDGEVCTLDLEEDETFALLCVVKKDIMIKGMKVCYLSLVTSSSRKLV